MGLIADLVLQTANAPGTATFNLIAPVTGRVSFVGGNGAGQAYYVATDGTSWEKGYGTVTAGSPDTLSRDTVIRNSLGTTAKINFVSTVTILSDIPAERAIYAIADNGSVAIAARVLTGLGAGFASDHAPRFDQLGGNKVGTYSIVSGLITVPLPNGTDVYDISLNGLLPATSQPLYFRVSTNGGVSYLSGASEYGYINQAAIGVAAPTGGGANISYAPIGLQNVATQMCGSLTIHPSVQKFRTDVQASNGTALTREQSSGFWTTAGTVTHVLIGAVSGASLTQGTARLVQRS